MRPARGDPDPECVALARKLTMMGRARVVEHRRLDLPLRRRSPAPAPSDPMFRPNSVPRSTTAEPGPETANPSAASGTRAHTRLPQAAEDLVSGDQSPRPAGPSREAST